MKLPSKPVLCFDFDGVINSYRSGWTGADDLPDPPVPGAIEALLGYLEHFTVCIHSSRFNAWQDAEMQPQTAVETWLVTHGVPEERINKDADNVGLNPLEINLCATKPPALVTLDDRGWTFTGTFPTVAEIAGFRTWQRQDI